MEASSFAAWLDVPASNASLSSQHGKHVYPPFARKGMHAISTAHFLTLKASARQYFSACSYVSVTYYFPKKYCISTRNKTKALSSKTSHTIKKDNENHILLAIRSTPSCLKTWHIPETSKNTICCVNCESQLAHHY